MNRPPDSPMDVSTPGAADPGRRAFLKRSAALAGLALGGGAPAIIRAATQEIRLGYLPITDAAPLLIAHALGYFQEEKLNVPRPTLMRTWSALAESFLARRFMLTHLLLPIPIWMRYRNRIPVKILAWDHTNGSAITVGPDSGIKDFGDLGGRQIAVPFWYSMHNVILQLGLRQAGLRPVMRPQSAKLQSHEANLFILSPPEMPAALAGRKIDGYIVAEPFNALGEMKVNARILRFTGDIWKNHPCCVVVMREADIKADPVRTQKLITAIVRAQAWIRRNRKEAAHILSRDGEGYLPVAKDVLMRVFTGYALSTYGPGATPQAIRHPQWHLSRIDFQPYPCPSATRFITRALKKTLVEGDNAFLQSLSPDWVARDLIDDRFVRSSIAALGGWSLFEPTDLTAAWDREEIIEP